MTKKPDTKLKRSDLLAAAGVERRAFDLPVFGARHGFSLNTVKKIIDAGNGPHVTKAGSRSTISDRSEDEWIEWLATLPENTDITKPLPDHLKMRRAVAA